MRPPPAATTIRRARAGPACDAGSPLLRTAIAMRAPRPPRRLATLLGAVALLTACDSVTAPVDPAPTYDLIFVARVRGFDELFTLPLAGGVPQPVFPGEVNAHHPAPSPDGRQVAFFDLADDELWVGNRGGARARNVSQFADEIDVMPSWSPDGARIAFTSFRSGGSDIYVVNADGSGLRNLMPSESPAVFFDDAPAWSPDGTRIAFSSDRSQFGRRAIWTMRADGTELVQLTGADPDRRDYEPSWSPDGRRIVFRRVHNESGTARTDLAIVTVADGSVVEFRRPGTERYPSWSPDGAWIAYTADPDGTDFRVFTVRPDGSGAVERAGGTAYGRYAVYPRWIRRR